MSNRDDDENRNAATTGLATGTLVAIVIFVLLGFSFLFGFTSRGMGFTLVGLIFVAMVVSFLRNK